ncbi:MAG: ABC transporter permease subunit/CPBP intramembrane protease [Pirellulaceae bacterium]
MNWKHIQLIFHREMNDQLRDRRTLFTITILPILLYPLLGLLMMQVAQFNREHTVRIRVVGLENWPKELPLLDRQQHLQDTLGLSEYANLVDFETVPWPTELTDSADEPALKELEERSRTAVMVDEVDAVLLVKPEFEHLLRTRLAVRNAASTEQPNDSDTVPEPPPLAQLQVPSSGAGVDGLQLIANLARDHSQIAQRRLDHILARWQENWVARQLASAGMNPRLVEPLHVTQTDTAPTSVRRAMMWSKVLPFVMLVWALTGAFYPAIDLCAGEKERGTLETLLSSPARRREIVWGKLLTISVFSIGSALLNLMSMHLTAGIIVKKLAGAGSPEIAQALGPMPIHALGWLVLLLLPMAAFFSALALAVAALARSTKEGQYYLMPLLLITLPLVALPMIPSLELSLGTSLVPVTGAIFLVRSLIEGRYAEAVIHLPVVTMVTICCCWLSIRWAIRQFESESVMFREADRWNLRLWVNQVWRDRGDTASPSEALLCGAIILIGMFFAQFVAGSSISNWWDVAKSTIAVQIGIILMPCLLMAAFLTRSMRRALRIHRTQPSHLVAAVIIGVTMHPSYQALVAGVQHVYQIGPETMQILQYFQNMVAQQHLLVVLLLFAMLPAIVEELAFRGFIFGGLLRQQGALRAIVVSALFFGFTHTLLQQSISAAMMGLVLGVIAWRTAGVVCTIIVHFINNALGITLAWCGANSVALPRGLSWAIHAEGGEWSYEPTWIAISAFLSIAMFMILFTRSQDTQQSVLVEMA